MLTNRERKAPAERWKGPARASSSRFEALLLMRRHGKHEIVLLAPGRYGIVSELFGKLADENRLPTRVFFGIRVHVRRSQYSTPSLARAHAGRRCHGTKP